MMNPVDTANNSLDRLSGLLAGHSEKVIKTAVNSVLLFIILAVFGCFDFVTFTFNFSVFDFANHYTVALAYWTRVITKTIAGVCAFHIGMNLMWDREIEKSAILASSIKEYERLLQFKDTKSFDHFIVNVFNVREKKKAWVDKINRKIHRLNKFAKHKDLVLYTNGSEEEKAKNRYCVKRAELETMKSDEWVDKNIHSLSARYYPVDPILFDMDIDGKVSDKRGAKVQGNVGRAKAMNTGNVILGMVGFSMLTASIILSADGQQFADQMEAFWYYLLTCCEDIGVVAWQSFRGMMSDKKIISSEYIEPYANRVRVLNEYLNWCAEEKIEETKAYRILKAVEKSEMA